MRSPKAHSQLGEVRDAGMSRHLDVVFVVSRKEVDLQVILALGDQGAQEEEEEASSWHAVLGLHFHPLKNVILVVFIILFAH